MTSIETTFDPSFDAEDRARVSDLLSRATPSLERILGPAAPGAWTLRKVSREQRDSEMDFRTREIFLDASLAPSDVLHEAVHAWHALDLRYGLIEEGIALATARLVARELGYADMLGENVVVSDRTRPLLASHPADLVDRFPPLNALRYAVIRSIWTACVERQSGTLVPLLGALRALPKETSFIEDYGNAIRSVDEETFVAITSQIVQPGNAWVGLLAKRKEAVPYLALCAFADLRILRVVTGAKVSGTLDDRDRTIPIANDASFVGEGSCVISSGGKTVATVPFTSKDGAVNITLEQLPAGTYEARVSLTRPPLADAIEFTLA